MMANSAKIQWNFLLILPPPAFGCCVFPFIVKPEETHPGTAARYGGPDRKRGRPENTVQDGPALLMSASARCGPEIAYFFFGMLNLAKKIIRATTNTARTARVMPANGSTPK